MLGYLLDTNILSYLSYPDGNLCRRQVEEKLASLDRHALVFMSAISWGEFEYGWRGWVSSVCGLRHRMAC